MADIPVSFPPDLQQFVSDQISTGKYGSIAEVLCDAVRTLRDCELHLSRLRKDIGLGISQLESGDYIELTSNDGIEAFFSDLDLRGQQRRSTH